MTNVAGARQQPEHLVVGHIAKPHGTKGELFVMPLTDRPGDVFAPGRQLFLGDVDGRVSAEASIVGVESSRPFKRGLLVRLEEVAGREDADPIAGLYFLLPLDALPPREEGEFFYHELLGLQVVTVAGAAVGRVREVFDTEPHHLLEVEAADGKVRLIPFAERIVRQVDQDAGRLVIEPPEGLLDL